MGKGSSQGLLLVVFAWLLSFGRVAYSQAELQHVLTMRQVKQCKLY